MKKVLWLIVCLMTMVMSANAQKYFTEDGYYVNPNNISKEKKHFWKSSGFVGFGFGVGYGSLNPSGEFSHNSIDLDLICFNVLMSYRLGNIYDTSDISSSNISSFQLGCLIPILNFNKDEDIFGRIGKGKIFIVPFIEWIDEERFTGDGHYLHDKIPSQQDGHVCTAWIGTSHDEVDKYTEFGVGIMAKYGCGYLLGKFTRKTLGVSIGLCI